MTLPSWFRFFTPHKTIPKTPWTADHQWQISPLRILVLISGLALFGIGDALVISSDIGNAPWSVLAQGISLRLGISIGVATVLVGAVVLLFWVPLKRRVGLGTITNIFVISAFIDFGLFIFPTAPNHLSGIGYVLGGTLLVGLGSALYLTCGLGAGPRDGLMTGLHEKTGVRVGRVRLTLEVMVLISGALLNGTWGLGTALFALFIGQSVAIWLGVVARSTAK